MIFVWDETKRKQNIQKHAIDFSQAANFDFETALEWDDSIFGYNERRTKAIGPLSDAICVLVYTMREDKLRVISLRRANRKEIQSYVRYQER